MATDTVRGSCLIHRYDFPERVIGAAADYFIRYRFERVKEAAKVFPPEAVNEYVRCGSEPAGCPVSLVPARYVSGGRSRMPTPRGREPSELLLAPAVVHPLLGAHPFKVDNKSPNKVPSMSKKTALNSYSVHTLC